MSNLLNQRSYNKPIHKYMKLLTKELITRFEQVGEQNDIVDPIVVAKFFNPTGAGTWFAINYNPVDRIFFGYVSLFNDHNNEFGSFSLEELESIKGLGGLGIERDIYAKEKTLSEWKEQMSIA